MFTDTIISKLWASTNRTSSCWEWTLSRDPQGYGRISIASTRCRAHRIAWMVTHGPILNNLQVLHHCDNPPCINPEHLFLGTAFDNTQDRIRKGREGGRPVKHLGQKGVYWNKRDHQWMATLLQSETKEKLLKNLGMFSTFEEAYQVRQLALEAR